LTHETSTEAIPEINPGLLWRTVDDGALVISVDEGDYRVFNQMGAMVWSLIDGKRSVGDIARLVANQYEVAEAQAEADVTLFIQSLSQRQLVAFK
jgi:hypothetical protein